MAGLADSGGVSRRSVFRGAASAAGLAALAQGSPATAAPEASPAAPATPAEWPPPFGTPTPEHPTPGASITAVRGDRSGNWAHQTRSEVLARNGVVATSQSVAAQAGLSVLQDGGNAVDAAVATAAALSVVEPVSTSIGGDAFAIVYSAREGTLHGLNASGWAPRAWDLEYFHRRGHDKGTGMPMYGVDTINVPGAVDGWDQLLRRFGSRGFGSVLEPAVRLAEEGFGVTERIHAQWAESVRLLRSDPDSAEAFLTDGQVPPLYSVFRNAGMGRALRALQSGGRDAFYTGEIAEAIVAKIRRHGGSMTAADLADFRSEWVDPLTVPYHDYDVYELPPTTQGFACLEMLNILRRCPDVHGLDLAKLGPRSPQFWHLLIEAKKLAYSDLHTYNADPRFAQVPVTWLLSDEHALELCKRIDPNQAHPPAVRGSATGGTVYLTTADRWGNMVSFIYSTYQHFGSGLTVPGYGFPLQDRAALFSLDPHSPNVVEPRKRPFHTLIPGFIMRGGTPVLSFGNMGGDAQPQCQATEVVNLIDLGMNPQAAVDAARFVHEQEEDVVDLESQLHALVGGQLAEMGHSVRVSSGDPMGGYQAIHFTPLAEETVAGPLNGLYRAASDHRKDGQAVGW